MPRKKRVVQSDTIRVCCRFRPLNSREKKLGAKINVRVSDSSIATISRGRQKDDFHFDRIFDTTASQPQVYQYSVSHMIESVMQGFNCTVFAYGQTGSGKTYSMEGSLGSPIRGMVPRLVEDLFEAIRDSDEIYEYRVKVSYVEIYMNKLRDLFAPENTNMRIQESKFGVKIAGVTELNVGGVQNVLDLMQEGAANRATDKTAMNEESSRSHGIFMVKLEKLNLETKAKTLSKLMMVDLAGSEKVRNTGATGQRFKEAMQINSALTALGIVMKALSEGANFIPYRNSVLTYLLRDSLGGNCKTTLIVCASPADSNVEETLSTLRFGTRAKTVKNKAKVNAEKTAAQYKKELKEAKEKIKLLEKLIIYLERDLGLACSGKMTSTEQSQGLAFKKQNGIRIKQREEELEGVQTVSPSNTSSGNMSADLGLLEKSTDDDTFSHTAESTDFNNSDWAKESNLLRLNLEKQDSVTLSSSEIKQLVIANDNLASRNGELRQEVTRMRTDLMVKAEALIGEKEKTDEAESQYEMAFVENRTFKDKVLTLELDLTRFKQERDDLKVELQNKSVEITSMKEYTDQLVMTKEDEIESIRQAEKQRCEAFIAEAREAIANRVPLQNQKTTGFGARSEERLNAYRDQQMNRYMQQMQEQRAPQQLQEFEELKRKNEEVLHRSRALEESIRRKDARLVTQNNDIVMLGHMKRKAAEVLNEEILKLTKQLEKSRKQVSALSREVESLRENTKTLGEPRRDAGSKIVKKKLQSLVMPIRGGRKKKRHARAKSRDRASRAHKKNPSMMQQGVPIQQLFGSQGDVMSNDVLNQEMPQIPALGMQSMYGDQQLFRQNTIDQQLFRQNTFTPAPPIQGIQQGMQGMQQPMQGMPQQMHPHMQQQMQWQQEQQFAMMQHLRQNSQYGSQFFM